MQKYDEEEFLRDAEEMKNKVSKIKLSEEFKAQLQEKMDLEFEKETVNSNLESDNKIKLKLNNLFFIPKFAVALCLIVLVSGCITFADEIESFVSQIFSNTDRELEMAIENGNYREIDMDYIESDGVAIKVDYIVEDEDSLYIAFNVKTEEEFENVAFTDFVLKTSDNIIIYECKEFIKNRSTMKYLQKKLSSNNIMLIYEFHNIEYAKNISEEWNVEIRRINCFDKNNLLKELILDNVNIFINTKKEG